MTSKYRPQQYNEGANRFLNDRMNDMYGMPAGSRTGALMEYMTNDDSYTESDGHGGYPVPSRWNKSNREFLAGQKSADQGRGLLDSIPASAAPANFGTGNLDAYGRRMERHDMPSPSPVNKFLNERMGRSIESGPSHSLPGRGLMDVPAGFAPASGDMGPVNHWLNDRMYKRGGIPERQHRYMTGDGDYDPKHYNSAADDMYSPENRSGYGGAGTGKRAMQLDSPKQQPPSGRGLMDGIQGGTDSDMMRRFGPEDQVAYDKQGNPIPLRDPRHPANQRR